MQPVDQLLPATFLERLRQIVGPEYQRCLASFTASPPVAFRVNTLSAAVVDVLGELAALGLHAEGVPWYAEAFLVPATKRDLLVGSAPCRQGRLYMQNLSSMLPALVLNPARAKRSWTWRPLPAARRCRWPR